MRTLQFITCLTAALVAASAYAQPGYRGGYGRGYYGWGGYGGGYGGYGGYGFASTIAEGYGRGLGAIISSEGQYNLMTSQAAINAEDAWTKDIKNRKEWTEAYYQMRQLHDSVKGEEYAKGRQSAEDWIRRSQEQQPRRLPPDQLDPITGELRWPDALKTDEYKDLRDQIDAIFADRANRSDVRLPEDDYYQLRKLADNISKELRKHIREMPPMKYTTALAFLDSLRDEARVPPR